MSGTSPVVLPFRLINEIEFNVKHPLIHKLRKLYIARMEESINKFRSE
jgi:hypothetical protein